MPKMYGGPDGEGERADGRTGSWAGMGRARRPDQMASGIHRGAARPACDRWGNKRGMQQVSKQASKQAWGNKHLQAGRRANGERRRGSAYLGVAPAGKHVRWTDWSAGERV